MTPCILDKDFTSVIEDTNNNDDHNNNDMHCCYCAYSSRGLIIYEDDTPWIGISMRGIWLHLSLSIMIDDNNDDDGDVLTIITTRSKSWLLRMIPVVYENDKGQ